jgi:hypothetical protein
MSVTYLDKLNPEQRRSVEHGIREKACAPCAPLLVVAGRAQERRTRSPTASHI